MKLKLSDLEPNPFKKYINKGGLNEDRIEMLIESINHGTLPEHFFVRKMNNAFQVTSGHHRVEALKRVYSDKHLVDCTIVKFSDEQMLIDMVRENITQRDTDFHDTREGIVLARNWLESKCSGVKQFNTSLNTRGQERADKYYQGIGYRQIASFLSKNGKAVSYGTVKNYLDINDKLSPELLDIVKKQDHATASSGEKDKESIGVRDAIKISSITDDFEEQKDLVKALNDTREQHGNEKQVNLTNYKNAPDEIKQKVRSGEIDLADVSFESEKKGLIEEANARPTTIFIPNFTERLREFRKDVRTLEKQVNVFSSVFHNPEFKVKYNSLKPKQKESLNQFLVNIKERIKSCYDEVEFFMDQLPENVILLEK